MWLNWLVTKVCNLQFWYETPKNILTWILPEKTYDCNLFDDELHLILNNYKYTYQNKEPSKASQNPKWPKTRLYLPKRP